jgi:hypothetical protein
MASQSLCRTSGFALARRTRSGRAPPDSVGESLRGLSCPAGWGRSASKTRQRVSQESVGPLGLSRAGLPLQSPDAFPVTLKGASMRACSLHA